jgi:hypothetical protein
MTCCFGYSVAVLAHGTCDLMAVLVNLGPCTRRGGSYACPGAISRVVVPVLMPGRHPYTGSRVRLTRDLELYSCRRGGVLSARALTVLGMVSPQCSGWWHSTGDGHTGPEVTEDMCHASLMSQRRPGRASSWWPYVFRCPPLERDGGSLEGYREWWFGGPLRLFGPWDLFVLGLWPVRG